ncbi:MAG: beta-propeller fold lactonase family protein [Bacteroidales bacterium]|nr:beta-propeller fold lactonase family protein [Bacteroidales bacterium]
MINKRKSICYLLISSIFICNLFNSCKKDEKEQAPDPDALNADLLSIEMVTDYGNINFHISDDTLYYDTVEYEVGSIMLIPISAISEASIKINGKSCDCGESSQPINLRIGENDIKIQVTSKDGSSEKNYILKIIRKECHLVFVDAFSFGNRLQSISISPDGNYAYVIGFYIDEILGTEISLFARDTSTGSLSFVTKYLISNITAVSSSISPDGNYLYLTDQGDNEGVVWFKRDLLDGSISYIDRYNIMNSGSNHYIVNSVVVSPEGNNIYVSTHQTNAVLLFTRDNSTGSISYVNEYPITNPTSSIAVSPDGNYVYVLVCEAIEIHKRNFTTGSLTYIVKFSDEEIFLNSSVSSIAVSPNGNYVYVSAFISGAIIWFKPNPSSGSLSYESMLTNENILDGVNSVAISPDANYIYVVSFCPGPVENYGTCLGKVAYFRINK